MKSKRSFAFKLFLAVAVFCIVSIFSAMITGQTAPAPTWAVDDWSHHHLVFANPGTMADAIKNGTLTKWRQITGDLRYQMQKRKRSGTPQAAASAPDDSFGSFPMPNLPRKGDVKKDWSATLNGVAASLTSAIGTLNSSTITGTATLKVDGVTFDASPPTVATAMGTFSSTGPTNGQTATITNGSNALVLTATGSTDGTGTITVTERPGATDTLTIGSQGYTFATTCSTNSSGDFCIDRPSSGSPTPLQYAENIAAAIMGNSALCGTAAPCYGGGTGTTKNANVSAAATQSGSDGLVTVTNTSGTSQTFTVVSSAMTQNPSPGPILAYAGSDACSGSTAGTFVLDSSSTNLASNLAAAITACNGSYSAVGVTATSSGAVVTVTAASAGMGGNSITLAEGLSNFSWSASVLSNGADGTTSGTSTPPTFAYWSVNNYATPAAVAANIVSAINANAALQPLSTGVYATNNSNDVTVTANATGTGGNSYTISETGFSAYTPTGNLAGGGPGSTAARVQPNAYPAKFSFSTTSASCTDFVVYPTGAEGATGSATIIAYNNIYSSCSGAVPSVAWAYNTGTGAAVTTSPILSFDSTGSQVAFIQSNGTTASLVLLKWAVNTNDASTAPEAPTSQSSGAAYRGCTAPCMYVIPFSGSHNDTFSSPFYDYHGDALYVGDDSGNLHQFTGVFDGAPAESTSPWPVNLGTSKLSSPVYDPGTQNVIVGDFAGALHSVTSSGAIHGTAAGLGDVIADAPLVDGTNGILFAFVTTSGSYSETGDNAVYEFSTSFTTFGFPGVVPVGTGGTGYYLYAGTFDNVYYGSTSPPSGNIYVVGNTGAAGGGALYRVPISGGGLAGSVSVATVNSTEHAWPSPVTEFCNPGTNSACGVLTQTATGCTFTTTSTTITCSGGGFASGDVGASITGTNIPVGATISTFVSSTQVKISADPSGAETSPGVSLTIMATNTGTDYIFFSVNRGTPTGCTNAAGDGCILAYNVSYPGSISESGSGLNVTTPGTNGCWATGGFVIDNGATTAGASQIYFVNLNGISAGNPIAPTSSGCTAGSTVVINAVQAAQSTP
jgi:hypothetical protein